MDNITKKDDRSLTVSKTVVQEESFTRDEIDARVIEYQNARAEIDALLDKWIDLQNKAVEMKLKTASEITTLEGTVSIPEGNNIKTNIS